MDAKIYAVIDTNVTGFCPILYLWQFKSVNHHQKNN